MLLAAEYVLPVSTPHLMDGAVLVRDGEIVDVGERERLTRENPDEEFRDFGRSALLPGFVDLHTHLEYSAFRGLVDDLPYSRWRIALNKREGAMTPEDWDDAAVLGTLEAIQSGITTVADITDTGASVRAVTAAGLRAVVYREATTMEVSEIPDVMARTRADVEAWRDEHDPRLLTPGVSPHTTFLSHPELYEAMAAYAIEEGLPVAMHLAGSRDEYDFVKYGSSPLATDYHGEEEWADTAWLPTGVSPVQFVLQWGIFDVPNMLAVHCIQVDEDDVSTLARHDVAVATCPRCATKLGMGLAPLTRFFEQGIRVGLGTDSPASNNTIDFFDEMRICLLLQRSEAAHAHFYRAERFVRMATLEGARALRIDDRVGSLEAGKAADLIAVDLSHSHQAPIRNPYGALVHTANQEDVLFTMVAGEILYDAGAYQTVDAERALGRAEEMRLKLLG